MRAGWRVTREKANSESRTQGLASAVHEGELLLPLGHPVEAADRAVELALREGERKVLRAHEDDLAKEADPLDGGFARPAFEAHLHADPSQEIEGGLLHPFAGKPENQIATHGVSSLL